MLDLCKFLMYKSNGLGSMHINDHNIGKKILILSSVLYISDIRNIFSNLAMIKPRSWQDFLVMSVLTCVFYANILMPPIRQLRFVHEH